MVSPPISPSPSAPSPGAQSPGSEESEFASSSASQVLRNYGFHLLVVLLGIAMAFM
jgi:hypothetical protein